MHLRPDFLRLVSFLHLFISAVLLPLVGRAQPTPLTDVTAVFDPRGARDPVIANVEGHPIRLSELGQAVRTLPADLRGLAFDTIYPILLDLMIGHAALVTMARRIGLDSQLDALGESQAATEEMLEATYLGLHVGQTVTEPAIQARYNQLYPTQIASDEVRARHILVETEAEARKVLEDLRQGADFAAVARAISKDPDAITGGDLGFFRRDQVWPAIGEAAFALQPGEIAADPVQSAFGWHVLEVEVRRSIAPPDFSAMHDRIQQELLVAAVQTTITQARSQLLIHRFNLDGTELGAPLQ